MQIILNTTWEAVYMRKSENISLTLRKQAVICALIFIWWESRPPKKSTYRFIALWGVHNLKR